MDLIFRLVLSSAMRFNSIVTVLLLFASITNASPIYPRTRPKRKPIDHYRSSRTECWTVHIVDIIIKKDGFHVARAKLRPREEDVIVEIFIKTIPTWPWKAYYDSELEKWNKAKSVIGLGEDNDAAFIVVNNKVPNEDELSPEDMQAAIKRCLGKRRKEVYHDVPLPQWKIMQARALENPHKFSWMKVVRRDAVWIARPIVPLDQMQLEAQVSPEAQNDLEAQVQIGAVIIERDGFQVVRAKLRHQEQDVIVEKFRKNTPTWPWEEYYNSELTKWRKTGCVLRSGEDNDGAFIVVDNRVPDSDELSPNDMQAAIVRRLWSRKKNYRNMSHQQWQDLRTHAFENPQKFSWTKLDNVWIAKPLIQLDKMQLEVQAEPVHSKPHGTEREASMHLQICSAHDSISSGHGASTSQDRVGTKPQGHSYLSTVLGKTVE